MCQDFGFPVQTFVIKVKIYQNFASLSSKSGFLSQNVCLQVKNNGSSTEYFERDWLKSNQKKKARKDEQHQ